PLGTANNGAYSGLTGLIQSGRNAGASLWTGNGIVTSRTSAAAPAMISTLAISEASTALNLSGTQTALWNGKTVDATMVLIRYTHTGDTDLNGTTNGDDYFRID